MSELRARYLAAVRDGVGISGVSGDVKAGGGQWLGDESQQPEAAGCLHLDGSIQKSEGIGCRVLSETDQTAGSGVWTVLAFDVAQKNDFGLWNAGVPDEVVIERPGFYLVAGCCQLATSHAGGGDMIGLEITVNGESVVRVLLGMVVALDACLNVSGAVWLDENDVVKLQVYQDDRSGITVLAMAEYSPSLAVVRMA